MKLQLAYDLGTYQGLIEFIDQIDEQIDIIEIGTPLILREGISKLERVKNKFPEKTIFADLKIMDAGKLEAEIGFQAGADMVSVLGLASSKTVSGAKKSATKFGGKIMIDMINHHDPANQWFEYKQMGMDFVCLHTAHDDAISGVDSFEKYKMFHKIHDGNNLSLAGGVNPEKILKIKSFQPEIIVVGSYITASKNPKKSLGEIRRIMNEITIHKDFN